MSGKTHVIKSGKLLKFVSKAKQQPGGAPFVLPAAGSGTDPTLAGATLSVGDLGLAGGSVQFVLDSSGWTGLGNPPGAKGFRYKGRDDVLDPDPKGTCKVVLLKEKVVKAVCKGPLVDLTTPFAGASFVEIALPGVGAVDRYCAEFGGTPVKNDLKVLKRKDAPLPAGCSSPSGLYQASCTLDESVSELNLRTSLFVIPLSPAGEIGIECEDAGDDLSCACAVESFAPLNIPGIGDVCIEPSSSCPVRQADCDGDDGLDAVLLGDRNIGACTSLSDCESSCDAYCSSLGGGFFRQTAICEDFCLGGTSDGASCTVDSDCPDGSCGGPNGGSDGAICECSCVELGSGAAVTGGLSCSLGLSITIELDEDGLCGNVPPGVTLLPICGELTTATASGLLTNAGNSVGATIPPSGSPSLLTGVAGSCDDVRDGSVGGVSLVGHMGFYGSAIGDLLTESVFVCE